MLSKRWFLLEENVELTLNQKLLNSRNIKNEENFFNPKIEYMNDPFSMKNMKKSVDRIKKAINEKQKICIFGDYDVDGICATSLLYLYFKLIGYKVDYYIPNRLEEGYGLNSDAIKKLINKKIELLITVDCGISAVKEVDLACEYMDVIITDHHECPETLPNAFSILNPKQKNCMYEFKELCGAAIALKLIQALDYNLFIKNKKELMPIAALATVCDVVPLKDENRIIVKKGLEYIITTKNNGIKALIEVCDVDFESLKSYHFGFVLGPRINAGGRMGFSNHGVELFINENYENCLDIAKFLNQENLKRQEIQQRMQEEAIEIIEKNTEFQNNKVLVLSNKNWHHGIVGIVSSKITEKYYKPSILLCEEADIARGSARSIEGFDLYKALNNNKEFLEKFGGHNQAAGLSLKLKNISDFSKKINRYADEVLDQEDLKEIVNADILLNKEEISFELMEFIGKFEPFGFKNPNFKFLIKNMCIKKIFLMGKNKDHVKLILDNNLEAIAFYKPEIAANFKENTYVDIVCSLSKNSFLNKENIQLQIKDIRKSSIQILNDLKINFQSNIIEYKIENVLEKFEGDFTKEKSLLGISFTKFGSQMAIDFFRDKKKNFLIEENNLKINSKNIDLLFCPNIDKIALKRYNSIILFDFPYIFEDYKEIICNINEFNKIYFFVDDSYYENLKKFLETKFPNRDYLISLYKYIYSKKNLKISSKKEFNMFDGQEDKFMIAVEIFEELGFIEKFIQKEILQINCLPKPKIKVNLQESRTYRKMESLLEKLK